jgi:hypothetical protein
MAARQRRNHSAEKAKFIQDLKLAKAALTD